MNKSFSIEIANPEKLFLLWSLLHPREEDLFESEYGKQYIEIEPSALYKSILYSWTIDHALEELVQEGIIDNVYITSHTFSKDVSKNEPEKTEVFLRTLNKPKKLEKGVVYVTTISTPYISEYRRVFLSILLNKEYAKQYIEEYLRHWSNNDLYFKEQNILKKELQIDLVVKKIFDIVRSHSHKNMLFPVGAGTEIDTVATLLFLESIGDLTLMDWIYKSDSSHGDTLAKVCFRITLTDKFFRDFIQGKDKVLFDFHELVSTQDLQKKILFIPPFHLSYGESEYRLTKEKPPYTIMNNAFQDNLITTVHIKDIMKELNCSHEEVKKSIENFRRSLREKFKFPDTESFFEIVDEEIILKGHLFKFQPKKA